MATIVKREGKRGVRYLVRVRVHGEKPVSRTFLRKTDAKAWAAEVESGIGHGVHVPVTRDRKRTLADAIDAFLTNHLPYKTHAKDKRTVRQRLGWWREHAGYVPLVKLTPATIADFRNELARKKNRHGETLAGPTVNRYLAALSAVCKWAWKERGLLTGNPVLSVTKAAENPGAGQALTEDERARLLAACREDTNTNIFCAVVLALATGCRYSNLRYLRWENVNFERMEFYLGDTKNGTARTVPVVGGARKVIREQFENDPTGEGWVFKGWRDDAPQEFGASPWRRVRKAAGLDDFRFHDLRHTTASYLGMAGASATEIADALGHKTLAMAWRYTHVDVEHRREVLSRFDVVDEE